MVGAVNSLFAGVGALLVIGVDVVAKGAFATITGVVSTTGLAVDGVATDAVGL